MWRDTLLREEAALNAKLTELEGEGDDKRFEDAREEAQTRLAEVHARLADMDAESGPARAAALLAGEQSVIECWFGPRYSIGVKVLASAKRTRSGQRSRSVVVGECVLR